MALCEACCIVLTPINKDNRQELELRRLVVETHHERF